MSAPPVLEFRGIGKRFGDSTALADVDLELRAGESTLFSARTAAGRRRVRCALGLIRPPEAFLPTAVRSRSKSDRPGARHRLVQQHFALAEAYGRREPPVMPAPRPHSRRMLAARATLSARHGFDL
jgi:ABC-type uncharacterized transport system ATPase subunit